MNTRIKSSRRSGIGRQERSFSASVFSTRPPNGQVQPANPPANNVSPPLNIGSVNQPKAGGLTLGSTTPDENAMLDVEGLGYMKSLFLGQNAGSALRISDGNEKSGYVLTSDANGNATHGKHWVAGQVPASSSTITVNTPGTFVWTAPAGVGSVTFRVWGAGRRRRRVMAVIPPQVERNGGGGGGGAYSSKTVSVTPGAKLMCWLSAKE